MAFSHQSQIELRPIRLLSNNNNQWNIGFAIDPLQIRDRERKVISLDFLIACP